MKTWRLLTVVLTTLSASAALAHALEMPAKLHFDPALWLHLLQTLYPPGFGTLGAFGEAGALFSTIILAFASRRRPPAVFRWALIAAGCVIVTQAVFWIWVAPVNATLLPLTPETLPSHFSALRNQWEYGHAARAVLQVLAIAALTLSFLAEAPQRTSTGPEH